MIPKEILIQGAQAAANFVLDLVQSPEGNPLYRTKVMTVGYESVGKTAILDCLFPIKGTLLQYEVKVMGKEKKAYFFLLQGRFLKKYKDRKAYLASAQPLEETCLNEREWKVEPIHSREEKGRFGFCLFSLSKKSQAKTFELFSDSKDESEHWMARLKRVCMNEATHGIAVSKLKVDDQPLVTRKLEELGAEEKLELSIWDFAGQHDYYNNHHHFLSLRTIFLILFRLDQGAEGMKGLCFWAKSLSTYLDPSACNKEFSIMVVGTFLDREPVVRSEEETRKEKVLQNLKDFGLDVPVSYYEVSCFTLENIPNLEEAIYKNIFEHSYMGERVPKNYILVERSVRELRASNPEFPVVSLDAVLRYTNLSPEVTARALSLLSLWGECVYFNEPRELADIVILDPKFLSQGILADLFRHDPNIVAKRKDGIINHSDLIYIWAGIKEREKAPSLIPIFLSLLEKLGVLFVIHDDQGKAFLEQRSIIPSLLPEKVSGAETEALQLAWPGDAPFSRPIEVERIFKFNVLPAELISRLLVLLHPYLQEGLVWKNEVLIFKKEENTQGRIRAELELNRFIVTLRGSDLSCCKDLLEWIIIKVKEVARRHSAVKWIEKFRSPHDYETEIEAEEVWEDFHRQKEEKKLVCPLTGFPVNSEKLLERAGLQEGETTFPRGMIPYCSLSFFFFVFCFLLFVFLVWFGLVCFFFFFFFFFFKKPSLFHFTTASKR